MNNCKGGFLPRRLVLLSSLAAGGLILVLSSAVFPFRANAQGVDVRITELDCNGDPELVVVTNFGETEVSMTGWNLQSDPTSEESLPLSQFGSLSAGETLLVKSGPSANSGLVWSTEFMFRDDDPTDFAQLASDEGDVLVKVPCGAVSQPTGTPTSTPGPTAAPTALPVAEAPSGGGAPGAAAGLPPAVLIAIGGSLLTAGLGTFSIPLVGRLRRRQSNVEPPPEPEPALLPRPDTESRSEPEVSDDPLSPFDSRLRQGYGAAQDRPYLLLAVIVLIIATVALFLLQMGEKKRS